jgi:nucleotide-binding universal stress UspA family protein
MFKHILVPTDGSSLSENAARAAVQLAKALGARVTGFYASEKYAVAPFFDMAYISTPSYQEFAAEQNEKALAALAQIEREARAAGVPCETEHHPGALPYKSIIEMAQMRGCDLIFMASHGRRGLDALLLGSETGKVLTHTIIPVLVHRS